MKGQPGAEAKLTYTDMQEKLQYFAEFIQQDVNKVITSENRKLFLQKHENVQQHDLAEKLIIWKLQRKE